MIRRSERLVSDRQKLNRKYPDTAVSPRRLQPSDVLLYILQSVQAVDSPLSEVPLVGLYLILEGIDCIMAALGGRNYYR